MFKIQKIKILPLAFTIGLINLVVGLILGIFLVVAKSNPILGFALNQNLSSLSNLQVILSYTLANGVGGFFAGLLVGFLYNQFSKFTGGIVVEFVKESRK